MLHSSRMVNETYFEIEKSPMMYGPSAIQPSVGDTGAPVFKYIGNHFNILNKKKNGFYGTNTIGHSEQLFPYNFFIEAASL